jgi:tetratricopeptide (TPR) repeat protein
MGFNELETSMTGKPSRQRAAAYVGFLTRPVLVLTVSCLLASSVFGQHVSDELSGPHGPEAQFLELVDLVAEQAKQLELLDTFLVQFPKYEGMSMVHAQMQELCVDLKHWDRALELGGKLLAVDDSDIETVRRNLKAAEGKNDSALIAKWSERLKQLEPPEGIVTATSTVRLPFIDDDPTGNLDAVDLSAFPKQQRSRLEAILFNRALAETDPKRKLQLLSLFEKQFPASAHLTKVRYLFFLTHLERQDHTKALSAAEALLERDQSREDVLFYAAQHYFVTKQEPAKVLAYSSTALSLAANKPKPDEMTEEVWQKQKNLILQQAHWMTGSIRLGQEQWAEADRSLRAALAATDHGSEMAATLLTNLGWSNYKLRNIAEALKFYEQCVAIRGPLQAKATQSIASIKAEYGLQ